MRVFIYACEDTYHGLHGIEDMRVAEVSSREEADEYGKEMSGEVNETYDTLGDFYDDDDEEAYEEAFLEAREWYVYHINEEKAKDISIGELNKLACNLGHELFIKDYCNGEVE